MLLTSVSNMRTFHLLTNDPGPKVTQHLDLCYWEWSLTVGFVRVCLTKVNVWCSGFPERPVLVVHDSWAQTKVRCTELKFLCLTFNNGFLNFKSTSTHSKVEMPLPRSGFGKRKHLPVQQMWTTAERAQARTEPFLYRANMKSSCLCGVEATLV